MGEGDGFDGDKFVTGGEEGNGGLAVDGDFEVAAGG